MKLRPHQPSNIDDYDTLEHTGSAEDFPSMFEEGNITTTTPSQTPNIIEDEDPEHDSDDSSDDSSTDSNIMDQGYTNL